MYKNNIQNYGTALNDRYSVGQKIQYKSLSVFNGVWFTLHGNKQQKVRGGRKGSTVKRNTLLYRKIEIKMEPFTHRINSIRYMIDIST